MIKRFEGLIAFVTAFILVTACVAVSTLLIGTPHRSQWEQEQQAKSRNDKCDALAHTYGIKAGEKEDSNTGTVEKHRYVELCQQLRSALGSEDAAYWAWLQAVSGSAATVLAGVAAIAAGYAAYWASRTLENDRLDTRPWLVIDAKSLHAEKVRSADGSLTFNVSFRVTNIGRTPVTEIGPDFRIIPRGMIVAATQTNDFAFCYSDISDRHPIRIALAPGESYTYGVHHFTDTLIEGLRRPTTRSGSIIFGIALWCTYRHLPNQPADAQTGLVYLVDIVDVDWDATGTAPMRTRVLPLGTLFK